MCEKNWEIIVKQFSSPGALFKIITKKKRHVRVVFHSIRPSTYTARRNKTKKPRVFASQQQRNCSTLYSCFRRGDHKKNCTYTNELLAQFSSCASRASLFSLRFDNVLRSFRVAVCFRGWLDFISLLNLASWFFSACCFVFVEKFVASRTLTNWRVTPNRRHNFYRGETSA